jgi:hypothetical protein
MTPLTTFSVQRAGELYRLMAFVTMRRGARKTREKFQ